VKLTTHSPSSAVVKNTWRYTSYAFKAWCSVKHRNFTLIFPFVTPYFPFIIFFLLLPTGWHGCSGKVHLIF